MARAKLTVHRDTLMKRLDDRLRALMAEQAKTVKEMRAEQIAHNVEHLKKIIASAARGLKSAKAALPLVRKGETVMVFDPRWDTEQKFSAEVRAPLDAEIERLEQALRVLALSVDDEIVISGTEFEELL